MTFTNLFESKISLIVNLQSQKAENSSRLNAYFLCWLENMNILALLLDQSRPKGLLSAFCYKQQQHINTYNWQKKQQKKKRRNTTGLLEPFPKSNLRS